MGLPLPCTKIALTPGTILNYRGWGICQARISDFPDASGSGRIYV